MYIKDMARSTTFRLFLAAVVFVVMMVLLALILSAAQFSLSLWHQLQTAPAWVVVLIATITSLMLGFISPREDALISLAVGGTRGYIFAPG